MPQYEYRCKVCDVRFARSESMTEHAARPHPTCPKCASPAVELVYSEFFAKTVRKS